jgi:hypothetical protein
MHDDELTRLLRGSAPDARPSDEHRRLLRMQLDHSFRAHRRRRRAPSALAAAVVVVVALLAGSPVPIGSDVQELAEGGRLGDGGMRTLRQPFRGGGIAALDATAEARIAAENLQDDLDARSYVVVGIAGESVGEETYYDFLVESTGLSAGRRVNVGIPDYGDAKGRVLAGLREVRKDLLPRLQAKDWESESTGVVVVLGRRFLVTTRTMTFAGLGEVRFHEGTLLD